MPPKESFEEMVTFGEKKTFLVSEFVEGFSDSWQKAFACF